MMTEFHDKSGLVEFDALNGAVEDVNILARENVIQPRSGPDSIQDKVSVDSRRPSSSWCEGLNLLIIFIVVFSSGVTIALVIHILVGDKQVMPHGIVVSDDEQCSHVGLDLLRIKKGNAYDAVIGTYLCLTVKRPDLVSVGGDCGVVLHHVHNQYSTDTPPAVATRHMNGLCPAPFITQKDGQTSFVGPSSIGLPRFLFQLWNLHQRYGSLKWKSLFEATLQIASAGFQITEELSKSINASNSNFAVTGNENLWKDYGKPVGSAVKPPQQYVNYLKSVSENVSDLYYAQGVLARQYGGVTKNWTNEDFSFMRQLNSNASEMTLIKTIFKDYWIVGVPFPSISGNLISAALYALSTHKESLASPESFYTDLVRLLALTQLELTKLTNSSNANLVEIIQKKWKEWIATRIDQSLTSHNPITPLPKAGNGAGASVVALDDNHNYVALTATLGSPYGSGYMTSSGVILNNALSMFTQGANAPASHKYPWNYLAPVMVFNSKRKCGARFIMAGGGGLQASSSLIQTIVNILQLKRNECDSVDCVNLEDAIKTPRVHAYLNTNANHSSKEIEVILESKISQNIEQSFRNSTITNTTTFYLTRLPVKQYLSTIMVTGKTGSKYIGSGDTDRNPYSGPQRF